MITLAEDTYVTIDEARAYAAENGLDFPSDDDTAELVLKQATKSLDRRFGNLFLGYKALPDQPLAWPRLVTNVMSFKGETWNYTMDGDGNPRNFNGIQPELAQAVVELASLIANDQNPMYVQPAAPVAATSTKLDTLQTTETYGYLPGQGYIDDPLYKIKLILRPLLKVPTGVKMSRGM